MLFSVNFPVLVALKCLYLYNLKNSKKYEIRLLELYW